MAMNRIKELRSAKGLTAQALADLVGTTQATISRLENGERKLTVDWMMRIAPHLGVEPHELIAPAWIDRDQDEVTPYVSPDPLVERALASTPRKLFRVRIESLGYLGITRDSIVTVDTAAPGFHELQTGQVVLVKVYHPISLQQRHILRQFIAPFLLITNSNNENAPAIDLSKVDVAFVGVVIPD